MQFQRLKLSGFKSFVDATEFRIEPGLTGIVGPNGCGKSNLLEALRWVMGATSAKAMRGAGMEDVIFAGSDKRPSRNWAEVTLTIDNASRLAPQPFTDQPVLDIARRIDRGQGSTYRVNGKEVRARDVQLLFADASTGANSPALVRQGQISELIAAKPQNRRRVLEEAAGVSGLHTRRHEAELRLRAAEANMARLDDISRELDSALSRLKREARQADKYKKISAEIRALQKAILHARWLEAVAVFQAATGDMQTLSRRVEDTARAAATAQTEALTAAERIPALRDEEAVAATVNHRLTIEKERLDLEEKQALAEIERLKSDLRRQQADHARELELARDGESQIERLTEMLERVRAEIKEAPSREPELKAAVLMSESERVEADQRIEELAAELAALTERQRLEATRLKEAQTRFERLLAQTNQAEREKQALGAFDHAALKAAREAATGLQTALDEARTATEALEGERVGHVNAEAQARKAVRDIEDRLGRLTAESRGLAQVLNANSGKAKSPVLDAVRADKGYELALAAALGDDLNLSLSKRGALDALAFWAEDFESATAIDGLAALGVKPLAEVVKAPPALALRLQAIGVVAQADGDRLQTQLPMGARLVSVEGDLWRWDGLIVRARAPKPAAVRLAQRTRFEELENDIDALKPQLNAAQATLTEAANALRGFEERLRLARIRLPELERDLRARTGLADDLSRKQTQYESRLEALDGTIKRLRGDLSEAKTAYEALADEQSTPEAQDDLNDALVEARNHANAKRQAVLAARSALDEDSRNRQQREARERNLGRDLSDWTRRHGESGGRVDKLTREQETTVAALAKAEAAPETFEAKRLTLLDSLTLAETRLSAARDALAFAETAKREADAAEKAREHEASEAREHRAGALARLEAATAKKDEIESQILDQTQDTPDALGRRLKEEAIATPADAAGAEALLSGLERERDQLGAVNLRAEEEATEYQDRLENISRERLDLTTAIARLREGIDELNSEGRERLLAAFEVINEHFKTLFVALFGGGSAELRLVESDDPLEAGLEIYACPPGKRLSTMSLMSGGEQALTATALIFGVFLANPAPVCVLDEVDAPLDDANVDRYCRLLAEMRTRTNTRFIAITHNPVTMARMDRLFGVTMAERGVSQLVSVDLTAAEALITV
ncbi:chromosome segregation protein SMC [Asticcacaulis sp. YBE204]|uniref:chromosome segregation protein SMC n=1 Tax=Asticcacaulis sp. YBE204 TaxID=1282363 RepID=UPI0003C401E4|nr:chromosome segregation protein SMC [Asticcacaulis sp. YBE204]ESQ77516.1 chromosome partitioning protein Smc [Asticcacaulis sp. YBE204]